jgi:hypothetical protein
MVERPPFGNHNANIVCLKITIVRISTTHIAIIGTIHKGVFTLGVRDFNVESPNTMLVIHDLHLLTITILLC